MTRSKHFIICTNTFIPENLYQDHSSKILFLLPIIWSSSWVHYIPTSPKQSTMSIVTSSGPATLSRAIFSYLAIVGCLLIFVSTSGNSALNTFFSFKMLLKYFIHLFFVWSASTNSRPFSSFTMGDTTPFYLCMAILHISFWAISGLCSCSRWMFLYAASFTSLTLLCNWFCFLECQSCASDTCNSASFLFSFFIDPDGIFYVYVLISPSLFSRLFIPKSKSSLSTYCHSCFHHHVFIRFHFSLADHVDHSPYYTFDNYLYSYGS